MAQGKAPTVRKHLTFNAATVRYLEKLAARGTHGSDVSDVARNLVEQGVRQAIKEGFISLEDTAVEPDSQ